LNQQGYKTRKRFSQGAIQPIQELLEFMAKQEVDKEQEKSSKDKLSSSMKKAKNLQLLTHKTIDHQKVDLLNLGNDLEGNVLTTCSNQICMINVDLL
jgi:hypothetical protein